MTAEYVDNKQCKHIDVGNKSETSKTGDQWFISLHTQLIFEEI